MRADDFFRFRNQNPEEQSLNVFTNIIDKGGNILEYLAVRDPVCDDLGKRIKLGNKLGEGIAGIAYKADISGFFKKGKVPDFANRLVVKEIKADMIRITGRTEKLAKKFYGKEDVAGMLVPSALVIPCDDVLEYKRWDTGVEIKMPKGSIFCEEEITEFLIALWVGTYFTSQECINFMETFYFTVCSDYEKKTAEYYTFMEEIDRTYAYVLQYAYPEKVHNHIYIQALFAIAKMQHENKIVHGDLHPGNVFLVKRGMGMNQETEFRGAKLLSADYLEYRVKGRSIYLPGPKTDGIASQFIVKLGDWGRSIKYSSPVIGSRKVLEDEDKDFLPNWYNDSFDILTLTRSTQVMECSSEMIARISAWMEDVRVEQNFDIKEIQHELHEEFKKYAIASDYPSYVHCKYLEKHYKHVNPLEILLNYDFMRNYLVPPPEGSVILLCGEIEGEGNPLAINFNEKPKKFTNPFIKSIRLDEDF